MQGITTITLVVVVATGILTSVLGPTILKCLKVEDPVAIGLALGGTGHAVGTGTAFQYGQVAGAMGGLAIGDNRCFLRLCKSPCGEPYSFLKRMIVFRKKLGKKFRVFLLYR